MLFLLKYVVVTALFQVSTPCILLLNGWVPLSLDERVDMADIILSARVLKTYKQIRTDANTYTATIELLNVLKGRNIVKTVSSIDGKLYNVTNFGDRRMCYADIDASKTYIFYLTTFKNHLSAKYDDIFGAASDYSMEAEDRVLEMLGWEHWSEWTPCSKSCGGGKQIRKRKCRKERKYCEGKRRTKRQCNTFKCDTEMCDLLKATNLNSKPAGVSRVHRRTQTYYLTKKAHLTVPTHHLFRQGFPGDFSILVTAKAKKDTKGYILTIRDHYGEILLGVQVGQDPTFLYRDHRGKPGLKKSPVFHINLSDGEWHQFAFSIKGRTVTLYLDCVFQISMPLLRVSYHVTPYSVMALGGQGVLPSFEGSVRQLAIISDPTAAKHQCMMKTPKHKKKGSRRSKRVKKPKGKTLLKETGSRNSLVANPTTKEKSRTTNVNNGVLKWSDWSACSASCGEGTQSRTSFCGDKGGKQCGKSQKLQRRKCNGAPCPVSCQKKCLNGGSCIKPNACKCRRGYTGTSCERAVCRRPCINGGTCIAPNVCQCTNGFSGKHCHKALCSKGCRNGGKCVGANKCSCTSGYMGKRCQIPICFPDCKNGGQCIRPYTCSCKEGSSGKYCEKFSCKSGCYNGGTCVGPNKCSCQRGYKGNRCETAFCPRHCLNGGTCVAASECSCLPGWTGRQCQTKKCQYHRVMEPYQRGFRQMYKQVVQTKCNSWTWKMCTKTKVLYKMVYRTFYKPVYKCR